MSIQPDKTPKPDGYSFGIMKTSTGEFIVVKMKLKGRQIQDYEVVHPETSRGDAKRQLKLEVQKFCIKYAD